MAADVYQALRKRYPEGECVLLAEVSDTTGGRNRSADFIVVNLWPSRGLAITGFERKSYRGDWLNELKNPAKQEPIYKFCEYFYLLTDKEGVAKIEEIPDTWGWLHFDGKNLKKMKEAPKLNSVPTSRHFLCAMLRRAASKDNFVHISSIEEKLKERVDQEIKRLGHERDRRSNHYDEVMKKIEEFKNTTGIDVLERDKWYFGCNVGEAVDKIMRWEKGSELSKVEQIKNNVEGLLKSITNKVEDLKFIDKAVSQIESSNENTL